MVFFVWVVLSWPMTIVTHLPASRGSNLLKMSFCDKNVVWGFRDGVLGDGSPIVAF